MRLNFRMLRVLAVVLCVCAGMLCLTGCQRAADPQTYLVPIETQPPTVTAAPRPAATPEATDAPAPTDAPEATPAPAGGDENRDGAEGEKANVTYAAGYVRVTSATQSGWLPLPAEGEMVFPLRQITADGRETQNLIHLTPTGVYMESATCENQDCVHQGEVTLENRTTRALGNMIICLPNQVYLELYATADLLAAAGSQEEAP